MPEDPHQLVLILIKRLVIASRRQCHQKDHIAIYDIDGNLLVKALCRARKPFGITAQGGLVVQFHTDDNKQRNGFLASYKIIDPQTGKSSGDNTLANNPHVFNLTNSMKDTQQVQRSGNINSGKGFSCSIDPELGISGELRANSENQFISSPFYNFTSRTNYPSDKHCFYIIRPESSKHTVELQFTDIKLEEPDSQYNNVEVDRYQCQVLEDLYPSCYDCNFDKIEIFTAIDDDSSTSEILNSKTALMQAGNPVGKICGRALLGIRPQSSERRLMKKEERREDWVFTSKPGEAIIVTFDSDTRKNYRGFQAVYRNGK